MDAVLELLTLILPILKEVGSCLHRTCRRPAAAVSALCQTG